MPEHQELETKFLVRDIHDIELRLIKLKADVHKPRILETNIRFDTKDKQLTSDFKVLRLRQDSTQWLTYKEPGEFLNGIQTRHEIELNVGDIKTTQSILEALGFFPYLTYQKYRTVYILNDIKIMLDELPIGDFIEIEGDRIESIKKIADQLHLNWGLRIEISYLSILNEINFSKGLDLSDLTFESIRVDHESLSRLKIIPAD